MYQELFSERARRIRKSAIRELLKLTERPDIISFAGGLPDPETFPRKQLAKIADEEILIHYAKSLQYGTTEGSKTVRSRFAQFITQQEGIEIDPQSELIVTTASQQGLDLIAKTFIDPGDIVICGLPTYLGAIQAFHMFQARLIGIPVLDDGWDFDVLEAILKKLLSTKPRPRIKLFYVIPDWQNPAGICWSKEKRERLVEIAEALGILIVEDIPYRQLTEGKPIPMMKAFDSDNETVIVLFTFSKILAAGLRVGYIYGPREIIKKLVIMKQSTDLCTSPLTQRLVARCITDPEFKKHLFLLRETYRIKREAMLFILQETLGGIERVSWTKPEGGLFLMVTLPENVDTEKMLERAIKYKVAYVPGQSFFVNNKGQNTLRLCWSLPTVDEIEIGIRRLAEVIKQEISISCPQAPK